LKPWFALAVDQGFYLSTKEPDMTTILEKTPKTLTERIVSWLTQDQGLVEVESFTRYRKFVRPAEAKEKKPQAIFVGSSGGVRSGTSVSKSFSLTEVVHKRVAAYYADKAKAKADYLNDFE